MRQALHIFRKDARFLRTPAAISLALAIAFAWGYSIDLTDSPRQQLTFVLVLAWGYLAAAAIFQERPAGDRQFWTTRPYRWTSLLAAKALFLVVFIHLPLLAADLTIVYAQGFTPSVETLLWRQLGVAAMITIPAAALASITQNIAELALTLVGALATVIVCFALLDSAKESWPAGESLRGEILLGILLGAGAATIVWQFSRRRIATGRAVAGTGVAMVLTIIVAPPFGGSLAAWTPAEPTEGRGVRVTGEWIDPQVRFLIAGTRPDLQAIPEMIRVTVGHWSSEWHTRFRTNPQSGPSIYVPPNLGATMRASVILSIYGGANAQTLPVDGRPHPCGDLGRCAAGRNGRGHGLQITFWNTAYPRVLTRLDGVEIFRPASYLDYLTASPIVQRTGYMLLGEAPGPSVTLTTSRVIGRVRRDIDIALTEAQ